MADNDEPINRWRTAVVVVVTLALWPAHLAGSAWLSHELFRLAGGITEYERWTRYGGIDFAWTNAGKVVGPAGADRNLQRPAAQGSQTEAAGGPRTDA